MKHWRTLLLCVLFVSSMVVCVVAQEPVATTEATNPAVQRGAYLVEIMGCDDCHTPHRMGPKGLEPDMSRRLSGHPADIAITVLPKLGEGGWIWAGTETMTAFAGPWGVSFSANLTSDVETGHGAWTEKMFFDAMRNGRHLGKGRPILPPMPYWVLAAATDEDLSAIFAFLQSLPPIENKVPDAMDPPQAEH